MVALAYFGSFLGLALMVVANGYALSILWGWFIAPSFGVPTINVVQAMGITLVVVHLLPQADDEKADDEDLDFCDIFEVVKDFLFITLKKPAFAIMCGWIVHQFM